MKHTSAWQPTPATKNEPPGWISPAGRHYTSEHQDCQPPHWPPGMIQEFFLKDVLLSEPPDGWSPDLSAEEPLREHSSGDIPPDDELWNQFLFLATPITLPPDPFEKLGMALNAD